MVVVVGFVDFLFWGLGVVFLAVERVSCRVS